MNRFLPLLAAVVLLTAATAGAARAATIVIEQPVRVIAEIPPFDRYVAPHSVQGRVTSFNRFNMTVRIHEADCSVLLHHGTIINPTGTTLVPGMIVNVHGYWQNGIFHANAINLVG